MHQVLRIGCLIVIWLVMAGTASAQSGYISTISVSPNPFTEGQSVQIKVGASWQAYGYADYVWVTQVSMEVQGNDGYHAVQTKNVSPTQSTQTTFTFTDGITAGLTTGVNYSMEMWVQYYNGEYGYHEWYGPDYGYAQVSYKPPSGEAGPPNGETTTAIGWNTAKPYRTTQAHRMTLYGTQNYGGLYVFEQAAAGSDIDYCHYSGSAIPKQHGVSGDNWPVQSDNRWGNDSVGWLENAVAHYRVAKRAPCGYHVLQVMYINMPNGTFGYKSNQLSMEIKATKVATRRDDQYRERTW